MNKKVKGKMLLRNRIIVLTNQPFFESDLIVRGLNTKGCQLSFIAKGALKSKKRFFGGVLEPTAYIEIEYRPSKKSLHKLQQAWFLEDFSDLRKDYNRLNLALYFLKVIRQISQEGTEDSEELFHLLGNALMEAQNSPCLDSLKLFFQVKILFLQGVLPKELSPSEILKSALHQHKNFEMNEGKKKNLLNQLDQSLKLYLEM